MPYAYYVRYGLTGRVGRFPAPAGGLARGHKVVLQTHRGTELGDVLLAADEHAALPAYHAACVIRAATCDDLARAEEAARDRHRRFAACRQVFEDGAWPFDLIDVEPLLDEGRTVVHYLGPHGLDVSGLRGVLRSAYALDVVFEAAGRDAPDEPSQPEHADVAGCSHCGSGGGGCGSGGGGCGTTAHAGGCGECALRQWTAAAVGTAAHGPR
jgi:cell fate regulator YaaT (PSP1 superfamily)